MSATPSVRTAAIWGMASQYVVFAAQFATSVIISRFFLTPGEVGLFGTALAAAMMVAVFQDFGIGRYVSGEADLDDAKIRRVFSVSVAIALTVGVIVHGLDDSERAQAYAAETRQAQRTRRDAAAGAEDERLAVLRLAQIILAGKDRRDRRHPVIDAVVVDQRRIEGGGQRERAERTAIRGVNGRGAAGDDLLAQNYPLIHAVGRAAREAPRPSASLACPDKAPKLIPVI